MSTDANTERIPRSTDGLSDGELLVEIFDRVNLLSDELNDPDGMIAARFRGVDEKLQQSENRQIGILRRILAEVLVIKSRLGKAEDQLKIQAASKILNRANVEAPGVQ